MSRIIEILTVTNIINHQEGNRVRYKKRKQIWFTYYPKAFASYRNFTKVEKGNRKIDVGYGYRNKIQKQL